MTSKRIRVAVAGISCGVVASALYWPTLGAQFAWDDHVLIVGNPDLQRWDGFFRCFTTAVGAENWVAYYRPLLMASYLVDRKIWGLDPGGFHLTNALLHGVNTALVFLLGATYFESLLAAAIGALLFAVHPIQGQAVSLVLGRNDLLLVPPVVGMLLLGDRGRPLLPMMLLYAAALWTKETGLVAPLLLYAADAVLGRRPNESDRRWGRLAAGFAAIAAFYLVIRVVVLGSLVSLPSGAVPLWTDWLAQSITVLGYYLLHVVLPWGLSPVPYSIRITRGLALFQSIASCGAFILAIGWGLRRRTRAVFGLLFFLVTVLPVIPLVPMLIPALEHRLYLPMVGVALAAAAVSRDWGVRRAAIVALPLLGAYALASAQRLPIFQDDLALWSSAVERVPDSAYAHTGYGLALGRSGREPAAIAELREAIRLDPDFGKPRWELALALERSGQHELAFATIEELLDRNPNDVDGWNALAFFRRKFHQLERSEAALRRGLLVEPANQVLLGNLADVLTEEGKRSEAERTIDELLRIAPRNPNYLRKREQLLALPSPRH